MPTLCRSCDGVCGRRSNEHDEKSLHCGVENASITPPDSDNTPACVHAVLNPSGSSRKLESNTWVEDCGFCNVFVGSGVCSGGFCSNGNGGGICGVDGCGGAEDVDVVIVLRLVFTLVGFRGAWYGSEVFELWKLKVPVVVGDNVRLEDTSEDDCDDGNTTDSSVKTDAGCGGGASPNAANSSHLDTAGCGKNSLASSALRSVRGRFLDCMECADLLSRLVLLKRRNLIA